MQIMRFFAFPDVVSGWSCL